MKTIEVIIDRQGQSVVRTSGFKGASCKEASRFIEAALGARVGETLTSEFHQSSSECSQEAQQGQG